MKLTIEMRDLFTVPTDYTLCHCISADYALGAGIAKKFAELGVREKLFSNYGDCEWKGKGICLYTKATDWGEFNLVTKGKYWQKPTLFTLTQSLQEMRNHFIGGDKIAMPKIGCGLDRLKWQDVEGIIREVFENVNVEILVCDWS